ncbi:hypothetical protein PM082_016477 [Marasmius tenuissimus]|nr:hypothetical protein PM082_016477 [Marasmius tenuissimus]
MEKLTISPENFFGHVRHHAGSVVLKIIYGYTLQAENDPYVQLVSHAIEAMNDASTLALFSFDFYAITQYMPSWFPGASFKQKAERWMQSNKDLKEKPWSWVKGALEDGTVMPSFCTKSSEKLTVTPGENSAMEDVIKNCATTAHAAGEETTSSSVLTFILAMVLHPELQIRAQKEIDSVMGPGRLPDFENRESLPFVKALLAETLRWNPALPLGVSHRALNDDVYEGYWIPAGTTIVPNVWAVLHNETLYGPDPMLFNPDRFATKCNGKYPPNPEIFAFGFGRRICPGRYLALDTIYLVIAHLLATFTIERAIDDDGNEIVPTIEYTDSIISHPKPFKCQFVPRSADLEAKET